MNKSHTVLVGSPNNYRWPSMCQALGDTVNKTNMPNLLELNEKIMLQKEYESIFKQQHF